MKPRILTLIATAFLCVHAFAADPPHTAPPDRRHAQTRDALVTPIIEGRSLSRVFPMASGAVVAPWWRGLCWIGSAGSPRI